MKKHINKIKTNLLEPGEPKDPDTSAVFQIWKAFATEQQTEEMRQAFVEGIAWGESKKRLFELVNNQVGDARERYFTLLEQPSQIEEVLQEGAQKARITAKQSLAAIRESVGIKAIR